MDPALEDRRFARPTSGHDDREQEGGAGDAATGVAGTGVGGTRPHG